MSLYDAKGERTIRAGAPNVWAGIRSPSRSQMLLKVGKELTLWRKGSQAAKVVLEKEPLLINFASEDSALLTFEDSVDLVKFSSVNNGIESSRLRLLSTENTQGAYLNRGQALVFRFGMVWLLQADSPSRVVVRELPDGVTITAVLPMGKRGYIVATAGGQEYWLSPDGRWEFFRQVFSPTEYVYSMESASKGGSFVALVAKSGAIDFFDRDGRPLRIYGARNWKGSVYMSEMSTSGTKLWSAYRNTEGKGIQSFTYQATCDPKRGELSLRQALFGKQASAGKVTK